MNLERIKKVLDAVRKRPSYQFDMGHWQKIADGARYTICCAVGSYAESVPNCELNFEYESGKGMIGVPALLEHFDIDINLAEMLFVPTSYEVPSKENVIARLERVIRENSCEPSTP